MKQIKKKIAKYGVKRRHIEIPQVYYDDFQVGDVVLIKKLKENKK